MTIPRPIARPGCRTIADEVKTLSRPLRLLIIQPYLPGYRVPFFDRLVPRLAAQNVHCRVAVPRRALTQTDRGDASHASWLIYGKGRHLRVASRSFSMYGSGSARRGADAVITGLASTSIDTWATLGSVLRRRTPVGVWGHVRNYVSPPSDLDQRLKKLQARRANHVFAYTPGGAQEAERWGVSPERITCVMNTVDTQALLEARGRLTDDVVASFQTKHRLVAGHTSAFVGALDRSKRIAFLAEALDHVWQYDPSFTLLLGGRGADRPLLERAVSRGQVVDMGYATADDKAMMGACASTLCMPGRIGLVAVDALALRLPVVTTKWPYHAPEAEYLDEGTTRFSSGDDPHDFAELLVHRTAEPASDTPLYIPPLTTMVDNFSAGVAAMTARL